MRRLLLLLLLVCTCAPAGGVQIVEFCPDPYFSGDPDEYVVLEGRGLLDGYMVTDREGSFRFPAGSRIDGRVYVARNSLYFEKSHGFLPDFELYDYSPRVADAIRSGDFRLANAADELILYKGAEIVQQIVWPGDVSPREGRIHFLQDGMWDPRPLQIGQSRFDPATFEGVTVTAFVSPDCSYDVFHAAVSGATTEILANVYEFTDLTMADDLVRARERGAAVTVLLEGGPVGGVSREGKTVSWYMNRTGIPVYQMTTTDDGHAKYRFNHAKYLVIDRRAVVITSENFKPGGFPPAGGSGNRGWGVYLEDPGLAAYFAEVFARDGSGGDIVPAAMAETPYDPPSFAPYTVEFLPVRVEEARVTPVLSPDTSHLILEMLERAESHIAIEQAYIRNASATELNPFLNAAIDASRRGVAVRVLLDSSWFNVEGDADNDEMVALINRIARQENLPLEARCADLAANNLEKIHTKGVIVDGREVLVSSINWNENSPNFNREAGVIIEHPEIGAYFMAAFLDDWDASRAGAGADDRDYRKIAVGGVVLAALMVVYLRRHR